MKQISRWFQRNLIRIYAVVAFTYLFIPVAYTFAFSFNDSGKSNLVWKGFTFDNWKNPCGAPEICTALGNSIKIGFLATLFSTIIGTMIAARFGEKPLRIILYMFVSALLWGIALSVILYQIKQVVA